MKDAELLLQYLDGNLGPEEDARVAELLRSDPEARAFLREVAEQAVTVADVERTEQGRRGEVGARRDWVGGFPDRTERLSSPFIRWIWAVAAAAVIVLLISGFFSLQTETQGTMARVVELNGSLQWTGDGAQVVRTLDVGKCLPAGTMETLSPDAWVEMEFHDGSRITVSGQSAVTFSDDGGKELHLREGNLSARVMPQSGGKALRVLTPTAMLEVLGTQLNVEAASSSTRLFVNEGTVRVTRLVDGSVVEVPAAHHVVASLSKQVALKPMLRQAPVHTWKSRLQQGPEGVKGKWLPPSGGVEARVRAVPLLLMETWAKLQAMVKAGKLTAEEAKAKMVAIKKKPGADYPYTMYLAIFSVSTDELQPVMLEAGARFRIRGRMEVAEKVILGFTANHAKGGFAGKFEAVKPDSFLNGPNGGFEVEVPLKDFETSEPMSHRSPAGMELKEFWIYTVDKQAGLEIMEVELLPQDL